MLRFIPGFRELYRLWWVATGACLFPFNPLIRVWYVVKRAVIRLKPEQIHWRWHQYRRVEPCGKCGKRVSLHFDIGATYGGKIEDTTCPSCNKEDDGSTEMM